MSRRPEAEGAAGEGGRPEGQRGEGGAEADGPGRQEEVLDRRVRPSRTSSSARTGGPNTGERPWRQATTITGISSKWSACHCTASRIFRRGLVALGPALAQPAVDRPGLAVEPGELVLHVGVAHHHELPALEVAAGRRLGRQLEHPQDGRRRRPGRGAGGGRPVVSPSLRPGACPGRRRALALTASPPRGRVGGQATGGDRYRLSSPVPGDWLSWLERCLHTAEVMGSSPVSPTTKAQVEALLCRAQQSTTGHLVRDLVRTRISAALGLAVARRPDRRLEPWRRAPVTTPATTRHPPPRSVIRTHGVTG